MFSHKSFSATSFSATWLFDVVDVFITGSLADPVWRHRRRHRQREFEQERYDRERLRKILQDAIDPIKAKTVQVVRALDSVVIIPPKAPAVAIPELPTLDVADVAREVAAALQRAGIEAQQAMDAKARAEARQLLERVAQENVRQRVMRKRRQEEFLLLMT